MLFRSITHFDASKFKTHFACEVKNFNGTDYIDRKELRKMDLYTQYAIVAAKEAVEDSGMDLEKEDLNRIGVIYGVGIGGIHTFEEEVANYTLNKDTVGPKFNPFFIPKMIADIASGQISIMYGFHGPNFTTTSACASSSNAIADAFNYIRLGTPSRLPVCEKMLKKNLGQNVVHNFNPSTLEANVIGWISKFEISHVYRMSPRQ